MWKNGRTRFFSGRSADARALAATPVAAAVALVDLGRVPDRLVGGLAHHEASADRHRRTLPAIPANRRKKSPRRGLRPTRRPDRLVAAAAPAGLAAARLLEP